MLNSYILIRNKEVNHVSFNLKEEVLNIIGEDFVLAKDITTKIALKNPIVVGISSKYANIGRLGKGVAAICYNLTQQGILVSDGTKYPAPARYKKAPMRKPTKEEIAVMLSDLKTETEQKIRAIQSKLSQLA